MPAPAQAHWHKAESDHFVIYADDSAGDIERFATMLERYRAAMDFVLNRKTPKPSPSGRVTIFVVGSQRDVRRLSGSNSRRVAGFYVPRASGSTAFVQDIKRSTRQLDWSIIILLHEYAHHHLISGSSLAWPRWVDEGAAEFFASAQFPRDGSVRIGLPAQHRGYELWVIDDVPIRELLAPEEFADNGERDNQAFYGRAWLLYHYLTFSESRRGQLMAYLQAIAQGSSSLEAATASFGDLDMLDAELDDYLRQHRVWSYDLQPEWLSTGPITLTRLSDGMDEMMPLKIRSKRGVTQDMALELLPEVRDVAEEYPDDPGVLEALAEAEFDAGNNAAAIAAADRALAIDPQAKNALVQKGYALFRMAGEADPEEREAAYNASLIPFQTLNRLENDHPLPLIYYYRSFAERGEAPDELARAALVHAAELAPFDHGLALTTAQMFASNGEIAQAREYLRRVAANPHRGRMTRRAEAYLAQIAGTQESTSVTLRYQEPPPLVTSDSDGEDSEESSDDDEG